MFIPDYLVYYHHRNSPMYQNILELGYHQAKEILSRNYHKKRSRPDYIDDKILIEHHIKYEFMKKGGIPKRVFPVYMSLGESEYLEKVEEFEKFKIPLKIFKRDQLSFTYCDSMFKVHELKPEVFMLDELEDMINKYGFKSPEVQIWDDSPINYLIDKD